jgi:hypothetical protein
MDPKTERWHVIFVDKNNRDYCRESLHWQVSTRKEAITLACALWSRYEMEYQSIAGFRLERW